MSQENEILRYLQNGGRLTGLEGLRLFGTMKLASRISTLKRNGHNIESRIIKTPTGKYVSEYWLEKEIEGQKVFHGFI